MWIVSLLAIQDLFRRQDPERLELRLPPVVDRRTRQVGASASLDLGGFGCGNFDLAASFRSQFDRQIAEEFLQAAKSDLASNALVLACQVSPTLCDAMKHYRLTASALLSIQDGQCRGVEEAAAGTSDRIRAKSVLSCLRERQQKGVPLDRALEECRKSDGVRDLEGRETRELHVLQELARFLKLDDDLRSLLTEIGQPIRLGGTSVSLDLNLDGIGGVYAKRRAETEAKWREALACDRVPPALLDALAPAGTIRESDVRALALLPEARREAVIRSLATAAAYFDLSRKLEELDRLIQAAETSPVSEEMAPLLRQEREWLRSEMRRLDEAHRRQALFNDSVSRTLEVLDGEVDRRFDSRLEAEAQSARGRRALEETRAWGGAERREPPRGSGCTGCGKTDFSIGSVRGK